MWSYFAILYFLIIIFLQKQAYIAFFNFVRPTSHRSGLGRINTWRFSGVDDNPIDARPESESEFRGDNGCGEERFQRPLPKALEQVGVRQFWRAVGVDGHLSGVPGRFLDQRPGRQSRSRHEDGSMEQHTWNKTSSN